MSFEELRDSLPHDTPPAKLNQALTALWWDGKGDWSKAHETAQEDEGPECAWVHAYLHRKEGDASNAAYWYRRAGKSPSSKPLEEEWREISRSLLGAMG
jgi:hypothetical protein